MNANAAAPHHPGAVPNSSTTGNDHRTDGTLPSRASSIRMTTSAVSDASSSATTGRASRCRSWIATTAPTPHTLVSSTRAAYRTAGSSTASAATVNADAPTNEPSPNAACDRPTTARQPGWTGWVARRDSVAPTRWSTRRTHRSSRNWAISIPPTYTASTTTNAGRPENVIWYACTSAATMNNAASMTALTSRARCRAANRVASTGVTGVSASLCRRNHVAASRRFLGFSSMSPPMSHPLYQ